MLIIAIVFYYLFFQLFYCWLKYGNPFPYQSAKEFMVEMTVNFIPIVILVFLNFMIVFFLRIPRLSMWQNNLLNIAESILSVFLLNELYLTITRWTIPSISSVDWAGTYFNDTLILLLIEVYFYVVQFKIANEERERANAEATLYMYDALKAQINPHFLFNSLNTLYSLVSLDEQKSKDFILRLSRMYRYLISQEGRETISLEEELEFLRNYISVLEMRYHNQLDVEIKVNTEVAAHQVIPYTLQLLMENVTKHNVISSRQPMTVEIVIDGNGVRITNPIRRRKTGTPSKIGLRYITDLYALHGRHFHVEDNGTTFTAYVPYL